MISDRDLMDMSGFEYWNETGIPFRSDIYSEFVEHMVVTKGQDRLIENTLGLVGEAGEVAEKVKKSFRGDRALDHKEVLKELGDVLFYVTALANHLGYDLQEVIDWNVDKLMDRKKKNKIRGDGDNR